ncbi:MAG TPA: ATP-binding cassette domain-containing protein [Holophagaceae bacterium]|nr:ATP-binding cassette domain-containing protein [Holophagaceae bacterium]
MELLASFIRRFDGGPEIHGELSLPLEGATLTILFGPSGCGKSTILRALAGLDRPQSGRIAAGGEVWLDAAVKRFVPAHRRRVGFLAQRPSLFPHLSVAANIGFGVKTDRAHRVAELLDLVGLEHLSHRRPSELSGGQQQRVALARALAPRPRLLLLDEPFAALDRAAQLEVRARLRDTLTASRIPALLVTHAREEALALGDQLFLMGNGRILQRGCPEEVFSHPAAAGLVEEGTVVKVRVLDRAHGLVRVAAGTAELWAPDPGGLGGWAHATIRPEGVAIERETPVQGSARNRLAARILALEPEGPLVRLRLDAGFPLDALVTAWAREDLRLEPGLPITALVKASAIRLSPGPPEA